MADIQLFGLVVDSTLIQIAIGIIALFIAIIFGYLNLHKKSIPASKVESSQSVNNSSGVIQQSADNMNIGNQTIIIGKKTDETNDPTKLNDSNSQLTELYLPMDNYIKEYIETITAISNDPNLLDMHKNDLRRKLAELRTKYPGRIDMQVIVFSDKFFNGDCPAIVFRNAVSIKIRELQKERERYLK